MNEEQKRRYLQKYQQAKSNGIKFFPDIIYKDLLISFALFVSFVVVFLKPQGTQRAQSYPLCSLCPLLFILNHREPRRNAGVCAPEPADRVH